MEQDVNVYVLLILYSVAVCSGGSSVMEMRDVSENRSTDAYLIESTGLNPQLRSPNFQQFEAMFSEGAPEFIVDQNLYYPSATNYGYFCTGFESPVEWEDHHRIFGVDGPEIQYTGAQNESFPYVYYTPSYGYAESPYNPYNPYIPGAMMGVDGSFGGAQHYYSLPNYQNAVSSAGYIPFVVPPDNFPDSFVDSLIDTSASVSKPDGRGFKHKYNSVSGAFTKNSSKQLSNQASSLARVLEGPRANAGVKKDLNIGSVSGSGFLNMTPSTVHESAAAKFRPKLHAGKLAVKAYTTKAGDGNTHGNIIIYTDQYNREDFPLDYENAKFFVIKSYSEDDVHKSIKYNVWSSTPHGNKKLDSAYEDAKRIAAGKSGGCPIFLFFSVNASGQFCGVAEMVGPVDFNKDMDFWQQDKWSGSFPVKWHIIKDVPNGSFRHIILENNESKPVTNSRDTQEIMYKKGLEMLKIFKSHTLKTTLLDDFMYYENRQKIMQEEKAKLLIKSFQSPLMIPTMEPPRKLNFVVDVPQVNDEKNSKTDEKLDRLVSSVKETVQSSDVTSTKLDEKAEKTTADKEDISSILKIGSVTITPKQGEIKPSSIGVSSREPADIVTVGSMQVKVNGFSESSGVLKVGSIPLDRKALQLDKGTA
ncbi:YT521-B-like domain containing protein [Stylosanthes scabra]|uniref:YTH domain-containing family protein n=1 Tax=Stylosanthes scabra TaxID=79078 RepID=A0ABU6YMP0_9FABA|nr:YT521-B-like domain containing protein [Stylosanthes scabra]